MRFALGRWRATWWFVGGSVPLYWRAGLYESSRVWPLVVLSVPAAAIGAAVGLPPAAFLPLLGGDIDRRRRRDAGAAGPRG